MGYALVTGASSGIGAVFARELRRRFPERGLILTARREERLRQIGLSPGAGEVRIITADLASPESRRSLLSQVEPFEVDILVNNAGFGAVGPVLSVDGGRQLEMIEVNCAAVVELTHALAAPMVRRGRGHIVNVASTAAFQPLPYMATYAATKAFLLSFSASLRAELSESGVFVQALCPGPTESEFHLAAGLSTKIDVFTAMTAEEVVRRSLDSLDRGIVVPGLVNRLCATLARAVPLPFSTALAKRLLAKYVRPQPPI